MRKELLFIMRGGEDRNDGLNYVLDLARILKAGVSVIMVFPKQIMETYEDIMTAVTFAEAGDHETSRAMMNQQAERIRKAAENQATDIIRRFKEASVPCSWHVTQDDPVSSIRNFLKSKPAIEMVLLSPNLSNRRKGFDLKKLLKQITRPVVTISKPVKAGI